MEEFVKHEGFALGHEPALYSGNSGCSEELQIWGKQMLPADRRQGVTLLALGGLASVFCIQEETLDAAAFLQGRTFGV